MKVVKLSLGQLKKIAQALKTEVYTMMRVDLEVKNVTEAELRNRVCEANQRRNTEAGEIVSLLREKGFTYRDAMETLCKARYLLEEASQRARI